MESRFKVEFVNENGDPITMILEHSDTGANFMINGPQIQVTMKLTPIEFEAMRSLSNLTVPGRHRKPSAE